MASNSTKLIDVANESCDDPEAIMKKIDKELTTIKFKAFGKAKEKPKLTLCKDILKLQDEKLSLFKSKENKDITEEQMDKKIKDIDDKITASVLQKQREEFEKELEALRNLKVTCGMSAAVFKMKEKVVGPKSGKQEATTLVNPIYNLEVSSVHS